MIPLPIPELPITEPAPAPASMLTGLFGVGQASGIQPDHEDLHQPDQPDHEDLHPVESEGGHVD